jgi:hypothetical protein
VPGVDQHQRPAQRRSADEIELDQTYPIGNLLLRRPGIAIAGKIGEHQPAAEVEEVELARPARRTRDFGERLAAGQRIDQARLADIRPAGERDLRQDVRGDLLELGGACDEAALLREQPAPTFQIRSRYNHWEINVFIDNRP